MMMIVYNILRDFGHYHAYGYPQHELLCDNNDLLCSNVTVEKLVGLPGHWIALSNKKHEQII